MVSTIPIAPALALIALLAAFPLTGQTEAYCRDAERFVTEDRGMVAVVEPDTIRDWRTGETVAGCRVTAAGLTGIGLRGEAEHFYERIRAAGWKRTPDPRDAPGEASLRFRLHGHDCLYNIYEGMLLFTEAEIKVGMDVTPVAGEDRYHVFVMCMPAMEARPRPG